MKHILFGTRIVENIICLNSVSNHCYHYNAHNYNVTSSSIFFNFKFDSCLFGNIFRWGLVLCRNHSIDLRCESFDWFLYGAGFCWRCFRAGFCCLIFCKYRFYHWFNLNVTELLKSSIVFYLSIHADRCCFVASKSRYF